MISNTKYLDFGDVLIKAQHSFIDSRSEVELRLNLDKHENKLFHGWRPIPVMSANMDTITDVEMAWELLKRHWVPVLHKYVSKSDIKELFDRIDQHNQGISVTEDIDSAIDYRNLFISRGTSDQDKVKLQERLDFEPRIQSICIDVANGHRDSVLEYVRELKESSCKDKILMVGNIGSEDMVRLYEEVGVDIVKAGIGPGSACITRVKTGVGTPQISLIDNVRKERSLVDGKMLIVSDGGCKVEGDIAKAFVAGADFVMIGGMLSGYKESPGTVEIIEGRKFKRFSGMAAKESQHKGVPDHGTEEGKTVMVPYKGKVYHRLNDIEGGLRSTCTYVNAKSVQELFNAELIISSVQENKVFS
jgi:GMP reductase